MANFSIKVNRETEILFRKLGDVKLIRLHNAFRRIGDDFRKVAGMIFENRGNVKGNRGFWPDLAESTKAYKRRIIGQEYPTLFLTGGLKASFEEKADPENVEEIKARRAAFGSSSILAFWHEKGAGNLPVREIINKPWIEKNKGRWLNTLNAEFIKILNANGIKTTRSF